MGEVFVQFRDDPALRVAIITAAGEKFFSAGWDLKAAAASCRNEELAKEYWKTAPSYIKETNAAFAAGIQRYVDEHPEKVPKFAIKIEPWQVLTIGRAMTLRSAAGHDPGRSRERQEEGPRDKKPADASNQWSVAPSRSADHVPILLADPHLTWEGLAVMYEARVHAGDLHMNGFFLIGSPLLGIGHNQRVGWALTTADPIRPTSTR